MKICKLCQKQNATQKNSHIISKFLGKRLFEPLTPRYSLQIAKNGKHSKIQDTPKEDFILCPNCEMRIGILETYFSRKITAIHDYSNRTRDFKVLEDGTNTTLECWNIHPVAFKLFFFSLFWRVSISEQPLYDNFTLPSKIEDEFRLFLNTCLRPKHKELLESFQFVTSTPMHHFIVFKPYVKNEFSRGVQSAFQISKILYGIFTPDLAMYLYTDSQKMDQELKTISNIQNDKPIVCLSNLEQWKRLNQNVIDKMLKYSNSKVKD